MVSNLTPKQQRFVEEFPIDWNAAQAAVRAGYSDKTARSIGQENLTKPDIRKEIDKRLAVKAKQADVATGRWLNEIARIAFSDVRQLFGPDGAMLSPHEWSDDMAAAVASVDIQETVEGRRIKIRLHNKNEALDKAARYLRLYDKVSEDVNHHLDLSDVPTEVLRSLVDQVRANGAKIIERDG